MSDLIIEEPLSQEVLALYHADALTEKQKKLVKACLTAENKAYLEKLDQVRHYLSHYGSQKFLLSDEAFARITQKLYTTAAEFPHDNLDKHLIPHPKNSQTFVKLIAAFAAVFIIFVIISVTHIFSFNTHPSTHLAYSASHNTSFSAANQPAQPHKSLTLSFQSKAIACVNHIKHRHYVLKQIISLHTNHSQHITHILLRESQPDTALLLIVPDACLLNPHKNYAFTEKIVHY